jgi:hypothetical protein
VPRSVRTVWRATYNIEGANVSARARATIGEKSSGQTPNILQSSERILILVRICLYNKHGGISLIYHGK